MGRKLFASVVAVAACLFATGSCPAEEKKPEPKKITIEDDLSGTVPGDWQAVKPSFPRFRKQQFALPRAKGDDADGVLIVFHFGKGGGGTLKDNLARWYGMVEQPDGKSSEKVGNLRELAYFFRRLAYFFRRQVVGKSRQARGD